VALKGAYQFSSCFAALGDAAYPRLASWSGLPGPAAAREGRKWVEPGQPLLPSSLLSESAIKVAALKWHLFNKLLAAGQYCYNEVVTTLGRK